MRRAMAAAHLITRGNPLITRPVRAHRVLRAAIETGFV
jgi:hypothetical protein